MTWRNERVRMATYRGRTMGLFDTLLKHLIAADAPAFAAWLLDAEVAEVEPVTVELVPEPVRVDAAFRVTRSDGQQILLHVEFQGRTSRPPLPWRMLDYTARLAARERLPVHSVVLYIEPGAGAQDTGHHQHPGADGEPILIWRYQVVHLWRWSADDLLAIGRRELLPLVGLTRIGDPAQTLPRVVAAIRAEPDRERQFQLLRSLLDLLPDEELIAMAQRLISSEDIEELKRFPYLWREYLATIRQQRRVDILEALVARFDPPTSESRRIEQALAAIDDDARLDVLFRRAVLAPTFADFVQEIE